MSARELVILGTASQVPTRQRSHHGAMLRFDDQAIVLDPGEGTQRQLSLAGVSVSAVHHICITHAHGDHCLGLPGVLQRLALDRVEHPVDVHYPKAAEEFVTRLRRACAYDDPTDVRLRPAVAGVVDDTGPLRITAAELSHALPTLGYRFDEPDGRTLLPDRLEQLGIHGPDRAELTHHGSVSIGGRTIHLDDVSVHRSGVSVGFVMDTRWCDGALELAAEVDLLLIEATFLESERDLAEVAGHLTASQAVRLGTQAGARRIVLTHFSQRYPDLDGHRAEAYAAAPQADVVVARDLDRVPVPRRSRPIT